MARSNYTWEKRQRDLAKKKKKEEKLQRKLERRAEKTAGSEPENGAGEADSKQEEAD